MILLYRLIHNDIEIIFLTISLIQHTHPPEVIALNYQNPTGATTGARLNCFATRTIA